MAVFRINSERGPVRESVAYVTRDGKLRRVDTLNLMKGRDIVSQFTDVMRLYGKGLKKSEVKTYDFVFSPSAKDGCSPESVRCAALEIAKTLFPCHQCVMATHTDTRHVHAHILVGAVDMVTGKKLAIDLSELTAMRKTVDEIGKRYGISPWDSRERGERTPGIIDRSYGDYIGFDSKSWLARARANIFFAQMKAQNLVEDGADPHEALKTALDARGIDMRLGKIDGDIVYGVREEGKEVRGAVLGKGFLLSDIDENAEIALKVWEMRLEEDFSVLRHSELADWESENVKAMAREAAEWFVGRLLDEAELGRWMQEEEEKEKREEETSARGGEAGVFYGETHRMDLSGTCEGAGKSGLSHSEWPADAFPEVLELFPLFMKAASEGRFESMGRVHDFAAENFQAFDVAPENDAAGSVENDFFAVPETHALSEEESLCEAADRSFAGNPLFSKSSGIPEDTEEKEKSLSVWERFDERRRLLHERIEAFKKKYGDGDDAGTERIFPEEESVKEAAKPGEEAIASWMGPDALAPKKEEETLPEGNGLGGMASFSRFLEKEEEDTKKGEERKLPSGENTYLTSFEKSSDAAKEEAAKARKIGQMPLYFSPEPERIDVEPFPERFSRENGVSPLFGRKDAFKAEAEASEKFTGEKEADGALEEHGARHTGEEERKTSEAENRPASKIKEDIPKKVCPRSFFPGAPEDGKLFFEGGENAGGDEKKAPGFFLRVVKAAGKFMREFLLPEDLGKGENEKPQKKIIAKEGAPAAEGSFLPSPEKEEAPKRELACEPKSYDRALDEYETADAWYCYAMRNLSRENGYLGIKDFSSQLKKIRRDDNDLYREIVRDDTHTVFSGNRGRMGAEEYLWEIYWNIYSAENRGGDLSRAAKEKFMRERADKIDYIPEGVRRRNEYTAKMLAAEAEKRREEDRKMAEERKRRDEERRKLTKGGFYDGK